MGIRMRRGREEVVVGHVEYSVVAVEVAGDVYHGDAASLVVGESYCVYAAEDGVVEGVVEGVGGDGGFEPAGGSDAEGVGQVGAGVFYPCGHHDECEDASLGVEVAQAGYGVEVEVDAFVAVFASA